MFDTIIGNRMTVSRLSREIKTGTVAHSMLFCGPPCTGKLTTALETARVLNCRESGEWGCTCRFCRESRFLKNAYLFLTGSYNDFYEIRLTADLLKEKNNDASRIKWIRSVRKLTIRLDRRFLPEEELKKINSEALTEVNIGLEQIFLNAFSSHQQRVEEIDRVTAAAEKLLAAVPTSLSVNAVRNLAAAAYAGVDGKKVIIIENADALSAAAANALLKILEEPPAHTYFILTATRQNAVLPTVLSRLRIFSFSDRSAEEEALLLKLFFDSDEPIPLSDFILKHSGCDTDVLNSSVDAFFKLLSAPDGVSRFYRSPLSKWTDRSLFALFWEKLSQTVGARFKGGSGGNPHKQQLYAEIQRLLNEGRRAFQEARQNPETVIETSFLKIRTVLNQGEHR